jgi:hypothetical protein
LGATIKGCGVLKESVPEEPPGVEVLAVPVLLLVEPPPTAVSVLEDEDTIGISM